MTNLIEFQNPAEELETKYVLAGAKRAKRLLMKYIHGKTLLQIGTEEGLSRERIRQILTEFPLYHEYKAKHGSNTVNEKVSRKISCQYCKKKFIARFRGTKFCSRECYYKMKIKLNNHPYKHCAHCKSFKLKNQFYSSISKNGYVKLSGYCKKCQRVFSANNYRRHYSEIREKQRKYYYNLKNKILTS